MKSNTFPEINILSSSSVKKEDSNKFPTKKNVYKSRRKSIIFERPLKFMPNSYNDLDYYKTNNYKKSRT